MPSVNIIAKNVRLWSSTISILLLALGGIKLSGDQTVIVRSGNGAVGTQDAQVHVLRYGRQTDVTPSTADFTTAQTSPFAYIVAPFSTYISALPSDPTAKWIGTTPGLNPESALYAIPFQVTDTAISSATLDLPYSVDNAINRVYINGSPLSGNSQDGDYHAEYRFVRNDIATLLRPNSTNWLYLNVSDYGGLAALVFRATVTIQGASSGGQNILPNHGGNNGKVSVRVIGNGFLPGAQLKLVGIGSEIIGSNTMIVSSNILTSTFDLSNAPPGLRTVVVTNPNGSPITLQIGFAIEQGGTSDVRVHKIGTPAVLGRNITYYIAVENIGTIDSKSFDVLEQLDPSQVVLRAASPPPNSPVELLAPASMVSWTVPTLGAGQTKIFAYTVQLYSTVPFNANVSGPVCLGPSVVDAWSRCAEQLAKTSLLCSACVVPCGLTLSCPVTAPACLVTGTLCAQCLLGAPNGFQTPFTPGGCGWNSIQLYQCIANLPSLTCTTTSQTPRGSVDPNDITGPSGTGSQRWITGSESMQYAIEFENLPSATKSATDVIVTDNLNASLLDLSTLTLSAISFGSSVTIPPNIPLLTNSFSTDLDLRPGQNLLIRTSATLKADSGQLTVKFVSIDPTTGLPPNDPLVGFLPPGAGGSILFTVKPSADLGTGTIIQNHGAIVFDVNPSIDTPTWYNSIDNTKPSSHVISLFPTQNNVGFTVEWSGADVGSGVRDYTLYVSDNGGPFLAWQTQLTAKQAQFTGVGGHTYRFFSIARDLVGNVESAKASAEATTTVNVAISLVANVTVGPSLSAIFPVTLTSPAGPSGVFITLTSSDPSRVALTSANGISTIIFIPAGSMVPDRRVPNVYGVNFGSATITATADGYAQISQVVKVTATLSFSPSNVTTTVSGRQQRLILTLSAPAPTGGLTVNLRSDNPVVATVPITAFIPANSANAIVPLTSVAVGSTVIHASALPDVPDTTAIMVVTP